MLEFLLEALQLLVLLPQLVHLFLDLDLFFLENLGLLVNLVLNPLHGHLPAEAQSVRLKYILSPLYSVSLYVTEQLLNHNSLIVYFLFFLLVRWEVELDLG